MRYEPYETIVIYTDGERAVFPAHDKHHAELIEQNIRTAAGSQVAWSGIRKLDLTEQINDLA